MATIVPPVPIPTVDLKAWAVKIANYLQAVEQQAKTPSPKIVQLERKQAVSKATQDGLLMFDAELQTPVYSFNKAWHGLVGDDGLAFRFTLRAGTPQLVFVETDAPPPLGIYRFAGAGSGNFYFQRSDDTSFAAAENLWRYNNVQFDFYKPINGVGSKFGAISVGVEGADQYITTSTVAMVFKLSSVAAPPASTINFYFRDSANTTMAGVYGAGTASANAVTIITREKGDLRYAATSSRRFKRNITKDGLPDLVRVFDALGLSLFTWGGEIPEADERFGKRSVGFIAEEVVELLPEAGVYFNINSLRTTFEERDVTVNEEVAGPLVLHGLDANVLIAMLFAKIKQLEARIP